MPEQEQRLLVRQRGAIKRKLTNFVKLVTEFQDQYNAGSLTEQSKLELQIHVNKTKCLVEEFENIQIQIEVLTDDDNIDDLYNERDEFTNTHTKFVAMAQVILN